MIRYSPGIRAKLISIFILIKVLPLVVLAWFAWEVIFNLGNTVEKKYMSMVSGTREAVKGVSDPVTVYRPLAARDVPGKARGIEGLRVADSSIFPQITNGNLNAPSIMVGEKMADHVLGRRLPSDNSEPWIHPNWREEQR